MVWGRLLREMLQSLGKCYVQELFEDETLADYLRILQGRS